MQFEQETRYLMSQKFEKLKTLLKELFQLDQPDLDFGLYRIMHAKSAEVTQFLDKDLLPQVKQAFGLYKTADKADLEKELAKAIEQAQGLGADPETLPKVKELRARLANEAVDIGGLENEVYDHLFSFFRRYYSEGDFLAKRVYRPGVYAIPYEGEEVKLHWANRDQYYIKTSEYLRDYAFRLRPDNAKAPMRVHFRLVDVAEGEHGNVKATEGKDRVFILAAEDFAAEEAGDLILRFAYRPASLADWPEADREDKKKPPAQKDLTAMAVARVLAVTDAALAPWIAELAKLHVTQGGETPGHSRLEGHLKRYTARNTFDYFIHKDLGGFLRRELDFYIKNEVMHLDDIESDTAPRVEQYLSKIKVVRRIAGKVIVFLAQLEDFQKKLWLKKKFVVETQYCITLDRVPEEFFPEIADNVAQREEWVRLFGINLKKHDLATEGYQIPLTAAFLKQNNKLVLDTQHFDAHFTDTLIGRISDLSTLTENLLVHSENENALRLIGGGKKQGVKFIYIDPPYNTGDDGFIYKDSYQHSSWCGLMFERLMAARSLMSDDASIAISIDQEEFGYLQNLCDEVFGRENRLPIITVKRGSVTGHKVINPGVVNIAEYLLIYTSKKSAWTGNAVYAERDRDVRYNLFIEDRNLAPENWRFISLLDAFSRSVGLEKSGIKEKLGDEFESKIFDFIVKRPESVVQLVTVDRSGVGADFLSAVQESDRRPDEVILHRRANFPNVYLFGGKKIISYSDKLISIAGRKVTAERASDIWLDVLPNDLHNEGGVEMPKGKKPEALVARLLEMGSDPGDLALDFFLGSGTSTAASQKSGRRWLGVEGASYFDEKPLRRMKNVLFGEGRGISQSVQWQGGGAFKYVRLESYEDALNNLAPHRTAKQADLLASAEAQGEDRLREQYMLRYMLDVETRGSQSLLNVRAFADPTAYKLKVKRPGSDESREVNVDLLETFNWLVGLTVQGIASPQIFAATFERDPEGRLVLKGRLHPDATGPFWFRTVTGTAPDGRRTLIIWRKLTGIPEQDNLVLDEWFRKSDFSTRDTDFDTIYVNGGSNLPNIRRDDEQWKVRLIEEDFHRLMFDTEGL
jgi:adenine-specific DNA-methyltransferase